MSCGICYETGNDIINLSCEHEFHKECLKKLLQPKCPLCRNCIKHELQELKIINKNDIKKRQTQEEYRALINSFYVRNYEQIDNNDLLNLMMISKEMNFNNWKNIIENIILIRLSQAVDIMEEICRNFEGIWIYYCDIETFFEDVVLGDKNSYLSFRPLELLKNNNMLKNEYYKIIKNKNGGIPVIIRIDSDNGTLLTSRKLTKNIYKMYNREEILKSILDNEEIELKKVDEYVDNIDRKYAMMELENEEPTLEYETDTLGNVMKFIKNKVGTNIKFTIITFIINGLTEIKYKLKNGNFYVGKKKYSLKQIEKYLNKFEPELIMVMIRFIMDKDNNYIMLGMIHNNDDNYKCYKFSKIHVYRCMNDDSKTGKRLNKNMNEYYL